MVNNRIIYIALIVFAINGWAEGKVSKFVSVRSSEANLRTGPNVRYPIKWIIVKRHEPVEIIGEFEKWRKVKDCYGDEGWIHESLLVHKRRAVVIGDEDKIIRTKAAADTKAIAIIKPGVRVELLNCKESWCLIKSGKYKGWLEKAAMWGIDKTEIF